jgi:hypothetical protein
MRCPLYRHPSFPRFFFRHHQFCINRFQLDALRDPSK